MTAVDNRDIEAAWKYHQATKHSVLSVQSSRHFLDWDNKPATFKVYRDVEAIGLPEELPSTGMPALQAVAAQDYGGQAQVIPSLGQIAYLLYYSAGITKRLVHPGGEIAFRAAACAGALYPIELYLVCGQLPGLAAGVYHFGPDRFKLRRLRAGDFREALLHASGDQPDIAQAPAILAYSAITWRSSWKYQARAYRYHFWDCGTILANSLAACAAQSLPASVVMGFADAEVNRLFGIDGQWEKSLALLPVGRSGEDLPAAPPVTGLDLEVEPLSGSWREYPAIDALHAASMLDDPEAVASWRETGRRVGDAQHDPEVERAPDESRFPLAAVQDAEAAERSLERVIVRRGSSRRFHQAPIPFSELSTMLSAAFTDFPRDWQGEESTFLNQLFLNVHAVDNLPAGSYDYQDEAQALQLLKRGNFRSHSAHLCLGQDLGGTSSATGFFLANLEQVLERYGNRGYRLAQMEAGILGGRLYLAAYALERGATGLTFFDDEVVEFFSPAAAGLEPIFVTALGVPAPPSRPSGRLVYTAPGESVR